MSSRTPLHRLWQPTLVMAGVDDPIMPLLNARIFAWRIPNARLQVVHGGGEIGRRNRPLPARLSAG